MRLLCVSFIYDVSLYAISHAYFAGGIPCLPLVWLLNVLWFANDAFKREPFEEQKAIRKCTFPSPFRLHSPQSCRRDHVGDWLCSVDGGARRLAVRVPVLPHVVGRDGRLPDVDGADGSIVIPFPMCLECV